MAAYDATGKPAATGNAVSSLSWTHTNVGTSNLAAMVLVISRSPGTLPTVTWGGASMTQVGTTLTSLDNGGLGLRTTVFSKAAPAAGAQTVSVSFGGTNQASCMAYSVTATAVNQTTPVSDYVGNPVATSSATTATVTPTNTGASDLVCDISGSDTGGAGYGAVGANQTLRVEDNSGASLDMAGSTQPGSVGNDPMTWTMTTPLGAYLSACARFVDVGAAAGLLPPVRTALQAVNRAASY